MEYCTNLFGTLQTLLLREELTQYIQVTGESSMV
jgi:hypothetical protein